MHKINLKFIDIDDIDPFFEPFSDSADIYTKSSIDLLMDNDEISQEEAAFMDGYNEAG
jgi:hypothetical protein